LVWLGTWCLQEGSVCTVPTTPKTQKTLAEAESYQKQLETHLLGPACWGVSSGGESWQEGRGNSGVSKFPGKVKSGFPYWRRRGSKQCNVNVVETELTSWSPHFASRLCLPVTCSTFACWLCPAGLWEMQEEALSPCLSLSALHAAPLHTSSHPRHPVPPWWAVSQREGILGKKMEPSPQGDFK
jgi:hypothetical protein